MMELDLTKAYLIDVHDNIEEVSPEVGREFSLEEVQRLVEGYIEVVRLKDEAIMIVNEEGKFCKKYNMIATGIADLHHALGHGAYICGNVVICPSSMLP